METLLQGTLSSSHTSGNIVPGAKVFKVLVNIMSNKCKIV